MSATSSSSQAWAILARHARDEIGPLRLQELCADNDRVSSLVAVHTGSESAAARFATSVQTASSSSVGPHHPSSGGGNGGGNRILIADLSRQLMTLETLNHLLRLSSAVDMRGFIHTLAWGQNNRHEPITTPSSGGQAGGAGGGAGGGTGVGGGNGGTNDGVDSPMYHANKMRLHQIDEPNDNPSSSRAYNGGGGGGGGASVATNGYGKKTRFDDDATAASIRDSNNNSNSNNTNRQQPSVVSPLSQSSPSNNNNNNQTPVPTTSPSMHLALRVPAHANLQMLTYDGTNALDSVHATWTRIKTNSNSVRKGQTRGIGGHTLKNILVVGRGVAFSAIEFVYNALMREEDGAAGLVEGLGSSDTFPMMVGSQGKKSNLEKEGRRMRFLGGSCDPIAITKVLADWEPEYTVIVTLAPKGDETDILRLTQTLKDWLYKGLKSHSKRHESIYAKHIYLITGSEALIHSQTITQTSSTFLLPQYARSEAFLTFTALSLLPLSLAFGWDIVQNMLDGAHDMDSHFIETNPRHNLPVLLALVDLWNERFLPETQGRRGGQVGGGSGGGGGGRMVMPFMESFVGYPTFVAAMEAQVCGRVSNSTNSTNGTATTSGSRNRMSSRMAPSAVVIDGGVCGTYDRVSYQGGKAPPTEMIVAMESQVPHRSRGRYTMGQVLLGGNGLNEDGRPALTNQDHLVCSFFAHADVMAFGGGGMRNRDSRSVAGGGGSYHYGGGGGLGSTSFDSTGQSLNYTTDHQDIAEGNRPSTLLLCGRCDAFTCGQLIALAEHRALVSARLWDVDQPAFAQSHASALRTKQTDIVREKLEAMYERLFANDGGAYQEEDEEVFADNIGPKLNLSATYLLGHYAQRMREQERWDDGKRR